MSKYLRCAPNYERLQNKLQVPTTLLNIWKSQLSRSDRNRPEMSSAPPESIRMRSVMTVASFKMFLGYSGRFQPHWGRFSLQIPSKSSQNHQISLWSAQGDFSFHTPCRIPDRPGTATGLYIEFPTCGTCIWVGYDSFDTFYGMGVASKTSVSDPNLVSGASIWSRDLVK